MIPGQDTHYCSYLNAVKGKIVTEEQTGEIKKAIKKLGEAEEERRTAKKQALADWKNDPQAQANHTPFERWAIENADSYLQLEDQVNLASGQVDQLQSKYYGAAAAVLREKKEKLEKLAGSQYSSNPGYDISCHFKSDWADFLADIICRASLATMQSTVRLSMKIAEWKI